MCVYVCSTLLAASREICVRKDGVSIWYKLHQPSAVMGVGVDGHGPRKAVCEGSIFTKISDIQPTHHTTPILMVITLTSSHVDYITLCMMSKLLSTFSIHHDQYTVLHFDKELHSDT